MAYRQLSFSGMPDWHDLRNYSTALAFWSKIKPLRGHCDSDPKPIGTRSNRNAKMVKKLADGSVAFRLHSTDVLTWHPDERITVTNHDSNATRAFAAHIFPSQVRLWSDCLVIGGLCYRLDHGASLTLRSTDHDWAVEEPVPFETKELDKAKAAAVRARYNLRGWPAWLRAVMALNCVPEQDQTFNLNRFGDMRDAFLRQDYHRVCEVIARHVAFARENDMWVRREVPGSLDKFTAWLMVEEGAAVTTSHKWLDRAGYNRLVYRNRFKGL